MRVGLHLHGRYYPPEGCQCRHCLVRDDEATFGTTNCCRACQRQGGRVGWCSCGRPMRSFKALGPVCTTCDEARVLGCKKWGGRSFMVRFVLLAPNDDRERVVLRSNTWFYGQEGRRVARKYFDLDGISLPHDGEELVLTANALGWRQLR